MKKIVLLLFVSLFIAYGQLGIVTRAGYTTYDWFFSGPIHKWCITDTVANGIHISWTNSFSPSTYLYAYYNFFNFAIHSWNWSDGIAVFTQRSAFSSMDNHSNTGRIYIMGNQLAYDQAPGAGLFEFFSGLPNGYFRVIAVTPDTIVHCAFLNAVTCETLKYSRMTSNGTWSTPIQLCPPAPEPMFPTHNIATSKISNKVIVLWVCAEDTAQERAYYRISNNSGITWQAPVQISFPPTNLTSPTYLPYSLYAVFDAQDNFHIVSSITPDGYIIPAEIWQYCPTNNPQWSMVFHYDADTLNAPVGLNATFACRPTIVQNPHDNYLYVAWEQFDSLNYEPLTSLARADIFVAESPNNGLSWQNQRPITTPNTTSKRFPCAGGVDHDTLTVAYLIDSIAGFEIYSQGRATYNPVVIQRIKVPLPGVGCEYVSNIPINKELIIYPNPARTYFTVHLPEILNQVQNDKNTVKIFDVSGKIVKSEEMNEKNCRVSLDGVKNGVYFVKVGNEMVREKLVVAK